MLFNTNLVPYDRSTRSIFSQMLLESVNGEFVGTPIETFQVVETPWKTWKEMYPNTKVLSNSTGFVRNYNVYPYTNTQTGADYRVDPFLLFPISRDDRRLPRKERTLGVIINDEVKAYRFSSFDTPGVTVIEDDYRGIPLVIAGNKNMNFMVAFQSRLTDGTQLTFENSSSPLPIIMKDNEGNEWDIFGEAQSGPRSGQRLPEIQSFIGFWFTWAPFYPNPVIYE